jgi:hypothetical protein
MQALPACLGTFRTLRSSRYRFGPGRFSNKVFARSIRRFPPVSARRRGTNRLTEAFADVPDIVDESDTLENGRGFPPFPVFPPVRVDAGETCERWNMLRSSWRHGREEICTLLK